MKIPTPIANKLLKLVLLIVAVVVLGIVLGVAMRDRTMILLSAGVAVAGALKVIDLFRTVKAGRYECLEGQLIDDHVALGRKRHTILLALEDGTQVQHILEGRYQFIKGAHYCFYLRKADREYPLDKIPESLWPASVVLGFEAHSFSSGKQF